MQESEFKRTRRPTDSLSLGMQLTFLNRENSTQFTTKQHAPENKTLHVDPFTSERTFIFITIYFCSFISMIMIDTIIVRKKLYAGVLYTIL